MPNVPFSFTSTPKGSDVFKKFFEKEQSRLFAERLMTPMPLLIGTGPAEERRHWDWKASHESDIVKPYPNSVLEPYVLKPGEIVFDEYGSLKKEAWDKWSEPLTAHHITEAMEKLDMPATRSRLPKKKKPRGDPRRGNYSARQFGNILLSMTKDIISNTTLNDALNSLGSVPIVHELVKPIIDEFFVAHGDKWQITGPMKLSAQNIETGKWKSVSALGGEILNFKDMEIGTRDGVCILWESGNIIGMKDEMIINTTIKGFGDNIVQDDIDGNPANRRTLVDLLLAHAGELDIVTAAEEARAKIETIAQEKRLEELERKSEAYGKEFGSWG